MKKKRALKICLGLISGLFLLCLGGQEAAYRWATATKLAKLQQGVNEHIDSFLEDQLSLMSLDAFQVQASGKDAGPYLNPRVRWGAGQKEGARYISSIGIAPIAPIPESIATKLQSSPENWLGGGPEFQLGSYDFTWMKDLQQFSYWELSESPNVKALFEKARAQEIMFLNYQAGFPLPELRDLVNHAKLRLLQSIARKDLPQALAETHHLAKLFYSTETLYGALMSIAVLGTERVVYEYGVARKLIDPKAASPVPQELYGKIKRVLLGAWGFYGFWTDPEQLRRTLGSPNAPIGRCAAIREGTTYASAVREHLYPHVPLEIDFRPIYDEMKQVATDPANGCRLKDIRAYWEEPEAFFSLKGRSPSEFLTLSTKNNAFWIGMAMGSYRFPYLRRAGGLWLATFGVPETFQNN